MSDDIGRKLVKRTLRAWTMWAFGVSSLIIGLCVLAIILWTT